jgi:uncharacterized protein YbjT (DUF2867 family)
VPAEDTLIPCKGEVMAHSKIAVAGATGRVGRHVVELLAGAGHDIVAISRSNGIDVITADGLAEALTDVDCIVDAATGPSPDEKAATEFFTTSAGNLQKFGERAGVQRIVVVSIIGCDRFTAGYNVAKVAQERAYLSGSIPARIVRAAQFHEFVGQFMDWGRRGDVSYVPKIRTQLVAARTVAEALVQQVNGSAPSADSIVEVAGPRTERLVEMAALLAARGGDPERVEELSDSDDPDRELFETDGLLPGPDATLAGPTFAEWLDSQPEAGRATG